MCMDSATEELSYAMVPTLCSRDALRIAVTTTVHARVQNAIVLIPCCNRFVYDRRARITMRFGD